MMNSMMRDMGMFAPADPYQMLNDMSAGLSPFGGFGGGMLMPPMPAFPRPGENSSTHHHTHHTPGMPGQMQSYSSFNSSNPFAGGYGSYSSTSMIMSSDGTGGRPHVYEQTSSSVVAPGGVRETKSSVRDSRTGRAEMAVGHHIQDRAHVIKKSRNVSTGQIDHEEDFVNVEEEEVQDFERNWQTGMARGHRALGSRAGTSAAIGYNNHCSSSGRHGRHSHPHHHQYRDSSSPGVVITDVTDDEPTYRLALPAPPPRPASNAGPSVSFNLPHRDRPHERASSETRSVPKKEKSRSKKPYTRNPRE